MPAASVARRIERLEAAARTHQAHTALGPDVLTDPAALARAAGLDPDPWQEQVLRSQAQTLLICCSRQAGKSTMVAVLIVFLLLQAEKMVVIVSPSERQSKELVRKVLTVWRKIGRPVAHVSVTRTSLELANHSRLEAFPASSDTIRGVSAVDLLVADEAAMVPDDLYNSVTPMLAVSNGRLLAPSTPKGKRGWWYGLWATPAADDPDIERFLVPATAIPRISAAFLARERKRIGPWWYGQEYECRFQDQQSQAFTSEEVMAAFKEEVEVWAL
jgi:hypothetical protein